MKFTIDNQQQLIDTMALADLKPGASLQTLCHELFAAGHNEKSQFVLIKFDRSLVAESYTRNPPMFCRSMNATRCPFPYLQSYMDDEYLCVRVAMTRKPLTFKGKAINALRTKGRFSCDKQMIPRTYRRRPGVFGMILTEELGQTVCNSCKVGKIVWSFKKMS